jgi:hypothetical protein
MSDTLLALHLSFDAGAGTCLWSANQAARDRFGYPVLPDHLPLPEATRRFTAYLCAWYDTHVDWAYPPNPSPWSPAEAARFSAAVSRYVAVLRSDLGPAFVVHDDTAPQLRFAFAATPGSFWR